MRALKAALLFAALIAAPASAQNDSLAGTWAFQTQPYGSQQVVALMSGVAVISEASGGRYTIRLMANEVFIDPASGRNNLITARENCTGEFEGAQFNISCTMAEPLEGYQPDNFVLQRGENGQLVGVLSSAANGQVTFSKLH